MHDIQFNNVINMLDEHTKDYRITAAVDKQTYNLMQDIALETFRTVSQVANSYILQGLHDNDTVLETTKREFKALILGNKSAELVQNLKNIDQFYDFKVNFWQICLVLGGKMTKNNSHSPDSWEFEDLIHLIELIRVDEPELYSECVVIMKRTLNKAQKELVIGHI